MKGPLKNKVWTWFSRHSLLFICDYCYSDRKNRKSNVIPEIRKEKREKKERRTESIKVRDANGPFPTIYQLLGKK